MAEGRRSGCTVLLYILAAVGALVVVVGAIVLLITGIRAVKFFGGEEGQRMFEGIKETVEIAEAAQQAPGTDEVRAAVCDSASVMNLGEMMGAVSNFVGEEDRQEIETIAASDQLLVLCQVSFGSKEPLECDELARIYAAAVPDAPDEFMVQSQKSGRIKDHCLGVYRPDGTFVSGVDEDTFKPPEPQPPPAEPQPAQR